jgi:parallel beta-helix repeat protein
VTVPARTGAVACTTSCLYVDANVGRDDADGRSPASAFRTLNRAAAAVDPGTTVLVMSGTYSSDGSEEPLLLKRSGTQDAWITFAAAPGQRPVIQIPRGPGAFTGIHLFGVSYVVIDGFEVIGQNGSITRDEAERNDGSQALLNEACIYVDGIGTPANRPPIPHDIVLRNNDVHHCSGGGVVAGVVDSLTVAYNRVHDNAWWTVLGASGLGAYHMTDVPGSGSNGGYKNFIVGNEVFNNYNNLPWNGGGFQQPGIYDGNGIIVDDGNHTQPAVGSSDRQGVPYTGKTYIANNVSHDNGGRGIHVYASSGVDVVNNTTYNNMLSASPHIVFGEIDAQSSSDVLVLNNVAVNLNDKDVNLNDGNVYDYNVWHGSRVPFHGVHDALADPGLRDPGGGDFTPRDGSPAIGNGTGRRVPTLDFFGNPRSATAVDRGAVQVSR